MKNVSIKLPVTIHCKTCGDSFDQHASAHLQGGDAHTVLQDLLVGEILEINLLYYITSASTYLHLYIRLE